MKRWLYPLILVVVGTICGLTIALAVDCHRIARDGNTPQVCESSDDRALATLMGLLSTLLALRVPSNDDDEPRQTQPQPLSMREGFESEYPRSE